MLCTQTQKFHKKYLGDFSLSNSVNWKTVHVCNTSKHVFHVMLPEYCSDDCRDLSGLVSIATFPDIISVLLLQDIPVLQCSPNQIISHDLQIYRVYSGLT